MKLVTALLIFGLFLNPSTPNLLKSNPDASTPKERMDWSLDPLTKKRLTWGAMAGGPAAVAGFVTQSPGRDITITKSKFGRQLTMAQTLLRANINSNRQLMSEIDELVQSGDAALNQMLSSTMRKIHTLQGNIEIKFNSRR